MALGLTPGEGRASRRASVSSLPATLHPSVHHISGCASLLGSTAIGVLGTSSGVVGGGGGLHMLF